MATLKNYEPTVDAQQLKRRLYFIAGKIGNRKKLPAARLFSLIFEASNKVH